MEQRSLKEGQVKWRRSWRSPFYILPYGVAFAYSPGGSTLKLEYCVQKMKFQIKAYVSHEDYQQIEANASRTGLSLSAFARLACLGQQAPSRELQQFRRELLRINADLGRLGGLLKLCLTQKDEQSLAVNNDARRLLWELEARQRELKVAALKLHAGCRP